MGQSQELNQYDWTALVKKLNEEAASEADAWIQADVKISSSKGIMKSLFCFFTASPSESLPKGVFYGFMNRYLAVMRQLMTYAKYWEIKNENIITDGKFPIPESCLKWDGESIPLTVVVPTLNEEVNIEECLNGVKGWADEIIVMDDGSTDRTVELAQRIATRVIEKKMKNEGVHRNWAMTQAKNDMIFFIDADEIPTYELKKELAEHMARNSAETYSPAMKTYIGKYWVQHSGWYPANKLRVMDRRKQWYKEEEVHPPIANKTSCIRLDNDLIHKGYPDFAHFLGSLNHQTTLEAGKWKRMGRRMRKRKAFWRAFDRFFRVFLRKEGHKDGFIGFVIAYFASAYQVLSYAKYREVMKGESNS